MSLSSGYNMIKSTRYSWDPIEIITSYNIPSRMTIDMSINQCIVGVHLNNSLKFN
jgi:hypothetical protein